LEAKISGFHSAQYVVQGEPMDKWPGVPAYMPPEAEGRVYDTSLDVFSFGVLALFTLTQESPHDIAIGERVVFGPWHDVLVTRSEVERREKYFTLLHSQLKRSDPLVQLLEQCLSNNPKKRPTAGMILEIINKLNSVSEHKQLSAKIKTMEMIMRSRDQEVNEEIEKVNLYGV